MDDFDTDAYFGGDTKRMFKTESPFLLSSSSWLNDPRLRHVVATNSLRRNHKDVPATVDVTDVLPVMHESWMSRMGHIEELFIKERRKNKALDAWFEERFVSSLNVETLKDFPQNTVGNIFYKFVTDNDFVAEFDSGLKTESHFEYFNKRLSQQHDLEHILSGFGFEYISEQAVSWMRSAAYFRYLSPELAGILNETYAFLLVPQIMRTMLHYPQTMEVVWDEINRGVLIGRTSEPIFLMKYEPVFAMTVAEARELLGYRNVEDKDVRVAADIWAEGIKTPVDPRWPAEPLSCAAE